MILFFHVYQKHFFIVMYLLFCFFNFFYMPLKESCSVGFVLFFQTSVFLFFSALCTYMSSVVESESNGLAEHSVTGKILKFPLRKWEEAH